MEALMATNGDRNPPLGRLYERWTLDVVPAVAPAAAALFRDRPQRFKRIGADVIAALARFHYRTGHDEAHLDSAMRASLVAPLLGESDGVVHDDTSDFHRAASAVRLAAVDFVQRSEDTGEGQLRAAFRDTLTTLERYLSSIQGAGVANADLRLASYFDAMVDVFQDVGFAAGFGLPPAPSEGEWPFELDLSGDGAVLVATVAEEAEGADLPLARTADQHTFIVVQRIGHFGRRTIEGAGFAADRTDEQIDALIDDAYRWWTAMRNLRTGTSS
jgi:hypothetical protein